jgi:hypothetical protein
MYWKEYFIQREKRRLQEVDGALPLFQDEEQAANRGLYDVMSQAYQNLITLRDMLDQEVERIVSEMNAAMAGVPSQTPFYRTAHKTKGQIVSMKDKMIKEVERLTMALDNDFAKQGMTGFNQNGISQGPEQNQSAPGHENWELSDRAQRSQYQQDSP